MPYWPQLRHCLFIRARTQAYLEKGLGADFYKLPRATAMRPLSQVRKSLVWILKLLFERQVQNCTERIRFSMPSCWVSSFTHRGVPVGIKNLPDTVRFTRALLESKDLSMLFSFPCAFGSLGTAPASWKQPLRKDLQEPLFPQAGSGVRRKRNKQASLGQVEAANRPVFESLYLEGMG